MATQKPATKSAPKKTKILKTVSRGNLYITATFNNTVVTCTDEQGNALAWSSSGNVGFAGSRKSTPYAATMAIEKVLNDVRDRGMREMKVFIKGPGSGRDAALRVLKNAQFHINLIADTTPIAHNGTKPRKKKHNR
jgi:small subunit ribosomal protein S11